MADKKKTSDKQAPSGDEIEDAVILNTPEGPLPSDDTVGQDRENPNDPVDDPSPTGPETVEPSQDAESPPDIHPMEQDSAAPADQPDSTADDTHEPAPKPHDTPARQTETVIVRKGGFLPMLLGGVAAAAIGFGAAYSGALDGLPLPGLGQTQDRMTALTDQIAAQDSTLSDLNGRLAALEQAPAPQEPAFADPTPRLEDLSTQIGVLAQRIDALEARPSTGASANDPQTQAALETARAELDQIRQALDAQRSEIAALTDAAAQEEQAARDTAQGVMQRAALTRIQTALDTGSPFAEAVTELRDSGVDVPETLVQQANDGVPSLAALQSSFPDLARDALRAARQQGGATGFGGFLETQLGLRSLQPREGDDPDAVLSRAEAALQSGDLSGALTELDALPDAATAVLADWRSQAETRLAVLTATQDLSQALNTN